MSAIATPGNHHTVTPYLMATDTDKLIDFLKNVFEAEETTRIIRSDGKVSHAELTISGSTVMLGEISTEWTPLAASVYVYVADADSTYRRAVNAGSIAFMEPTNISESDRMAAIQDPFGNVWWIVTHTPTV